MMSNLSWQCVMTYIDDCIIYSKSFEQHIVDIDKVLQRIGSHGVKIKAKKCRFARKEVHFLGHIISVDGISSDPIKTKAISEMKWPTKIKQLRSFLGMANYYRKFQKNYSIIAHPLNQLLSKGSRIPQTPNREQLQAFNTIKRNLCNSPILAHPDFTKRFYLATDGSKLGLGAVLYQMDGKHEKVICYISRSLTASEKNYHSNVLETLALVFAVRNLRSYLIGDEFSVITDSTALQALFKAPNPGMQLRWVLELQEYSFTVTHRPGRKHANADGPSRLPLSSTNPYDDRPVEQLCIFAPSVLQTHRGKSLVSQMTIY
jgi:hypothetical protein